MTKNIITILIILLALVSGYFLIGKYNNNQSIIINQQNCTLDDCLIIDDIDKYPVNSLDDNIQQALLKALDDEYKAYATYDATIKKFGTIRPFIMIIRAEEQHASSLKSLFDKYGMEIPENQYIDNIEIPETISQTCDAGVNAEIENYKLYEEKLLPQAIDYPDITSVFTNLMNASKNKHLPAFEKCAR